MVDDDNELDENHPIKIPAVTIIMVNIFRSNGKIIWFSVLGNIHRITAPIIIDVIDMRTMGEDTVLESFSNEIGLCKRGPHNTTIDIRIE